MDIETHQLLCAFGLSERSATHLMWRLGSLIEVVRPLIERRALNIRAVNELRKAIPRLRASHTDMVLGDAIKRYISPAPPKLPFEQFVALGVTIGWERVRRCVSALEDPRVIVDLNQEELRGLGFLAHTGITVASHEFALVRPLLPRITSPRGARRIIARVKSGAQSAVAQPRKEGRDLKAQEKVRRTTARPVIPLTTEEAWLVGELRRRFANAPPCVAVFGGDARAVRAAPHRFRRLHALYFTGMWLPSQKRDSATLLKELESLCARGVARAVLVSTYSPTIFYEQSIVVAKRYGVWLVRAKIKGDASLKRALVRILTQLIR